MREDDLLEQAVGAFGMLPATHSDEVMEVVSWRKTPMNTHTVAPPPDPMDNLGITRGIIVTSVVMMPIPMTALLPRRPIGRAATGPLGGSGCGRPIRMTLTGMVMAWDGNAADRGTTIVPGAVPQQSSYPVQRAARQPSRVYPFPSAGSVTIALGRIAFSVAR